MKNVFVIDAKSVSPYQISCFDIYGRCNIISIKLFSTYLPENPATDKQDMHVPAEDRRCEDPFQATDTREHGGGGLLLVQEREEQAGLHGLGRLDKRPGGSVIIDGVHLGDEGIRAFCKVGTVVPVGAPLQVAPVLPLLIGGGPVFPGLSGNLPAQVHDGYAGDFMEHIGLDVVVDGLFADIELRVRLKDLVRGEPLAQERADDVRHGLGLRGSQVDPGPGVLQGLPVDGLGLFRVVLILVETAPAAVRAAVTGTGRAVPPGTAEGRVIRAVRRALPVEAALPVSGAFQRQRAFLDQDPVGLDFLADGGLVLADGLRDGSFGRAVGDAFEYDAAFFQCQMGIGICIFHSVTSSQGGTCR